MLKLFQPLFCLLLFCSHSLPAQEKTATTPKAAAAESGAEVRGSASQLGEKLPVRRVVLYKNGVGYFEHLGRVRGSQDVHVDFTSAQLNDVLKSLTVLDLSGGKITGVDYNSEAPLARRLATLRLALGENPTMAEFLGALRGSRLEVRSANGVGSAGKSSSADRHAASSEFRSPLSAIPAKFAPSNCPPQRICGSLRKICRAKSVVTSA
jgi:hypothetical protein